MNRTLHHAEADRVPISLWIGLYPEEIGRFVERINAFALEITKAQIKAAGGLLDGMVIWGDVAYKKGGGYIFQSDHSVPSNVPGKNYDDVVRLVRQYGKYPLQLGEFDIPL